LELVEMPGFDHMLKELVETFHKKGALSPDTARTAKQLKLPKPLTDMIQSPLGMMSPFVESNGKYYLSEERLEELEARISTAKQMTRPRSWVQHTASVPKGYLRLRVIQLLKDNPMSGSEIAKAIESETGGSWKPRPGSIYPLLKKLLHSGLTSEVACEEGGLRRYKLTESGEKFLEEQGGLFERLQERLDHFPPSFGFGGPFANMSDSLREEGQRMAKAFFRLGAIMASSPSDDVLKEIGDLIAEMASKLEVLVERLDS
jgi:DNA-binding PadR family transcriptional regulator